MPELPSGTVTFLFTDIERSTQTLGEIGDEAYAEVLDTHRALLREAFKAHGGHEVGTEGDSFFVAFARAHDAVQAALDAQLALTDQPLLVRMGLHTGEALVREDSYVGHDVHKAKRISDAGHGGQVLVSQTTAELVRDAMQLTDLGAHRLKDLGEPQRLFQVYAEGLRRDFKPLRTLESAPHNLPVQLTSFVGRERELAEIAQLLREHRLVTLTGVGGCGKTRLAIHAAAAELESSPDGVCFCDLSRLADEDSLAPTLARALEIDPVAGGGSGALPLDEAIRRYLSRRSVLLVLDNCEHLVGAVAALVEDLLTSCPQLRVLATSREALEVEGEQTWSIPSLDLGGDAARLFAERAASVRSGFAITEDNRADVDAICERLDGIPLALELAAAQTAHLSPKQISERLDQRFMILTGGRRRVQRQQTLQAAMDWSWDLLDERDRTLLRRISVFQGGCTLEAAEAVCGDGIDVVSGLRSLVAKSLVVVQEHGGAARYRLLETVRLYAEDRQASSGESEVIRERHRDHYLAWAEAIPLERTIWGTFWRTELEVEEDNIRAGLRWSESQSRFDLMGRMLVATKRLWQFRWAEAPRWYDQVLAAELPDDVRGRVLAYYLAISLAPLDPRSTETQREALLLLPDEGPDAPWRQWTLNFAATFAALGSIMQRDEKLAAEAHEHAQAALAIGERLGSFWEAVGHQVRGSVLLVLLRLRESAEAYGQACRVLASSPFELNTTVIEGMHVLRHVLGQEWPHELEDLLAKGKRRYRQEISPADHTRIIELADDGDLDAASATMSEVIGIALERAPTSWFSVPLSYSGALLGMRDDLEAAARVLAAAINQGWIATPAAWALYRHWVPRVRAGLDPDRARALREEGRAMTHEEAMNYALERLGA